MRIAVCDDDRKVLEAFSDMLSGPEFSGTAELVCFPGERGLLEHCEKEGFDLLFCDIMLGESDGISTAAKAAALRPEMKVVFVTSHMSEYAEEIFQGVQPYGYIGKPVTPAKAAFYIRRLEEELRRRRRELTFSIQGIEYRIALSDIRYLESEKRQVHIHCAGQTVSVYGKLDDLQAQLDERFVRCHQSFAVNLDWVTKMEGSHLVLRRLPGENENRRVSVSRTHVQETRKGYFEYKGRAVL